MHGPGLAPGFGRDLGEELGSGGLEGVAEFAPEQRAQSGTGHEELGMRGEPLAAVRVEAAARDQRMHVDVLAHVALPCVQRPDHADLSAQPLRGEGHGLQRFGGSTKEEIV